MKKPTVITGLFGVVTLALPLALWADDREEAPPALSDVWIMVPKKGMEGEFSAAVAEHQAMRAETGDTRSWQVYTVEIGDHIGLYQFRACCFDWADQDAYEAEGADKGFGAHWNENVHPYVAHYRHYLEKLDWENSHWPDGQGNGPYYGVTTWKIKEGAGPAWSEARKTMSQLAINEGWASDDNNWLWISRIGGKDTLAIVSSYASYADMEPPEQSFFAWAGEQLGEEEAGALIGDFVSGFSSSDYTVWKHNEALSAQDGDN